MPKKKPNKTVKKKVKEIFEVKTKSGEKEVVKEGTEEVKLSKPGQDKHQNKVLRNLLIGIVLILGGIAGIYYYTQSQIYFDYDGVEFMTISEGDLIFYKTSIPVMHEGKKTPYNFYLRTKPTKLEKVPFEVDDFELMKYNVINQEEAFHCDGYGIIAVQNLANLHRVAGANFFKDENATCDGTSRYNYFTLKSGEETKIVQVGTKCYDLIINDCEILEVTEKLMAEMFVKLL